MYIYCLFTNWVVTKEIKLKYPSCEGCKRGAKDMGPCCHLPTTFVILASFPLPSPSPCTHSHPLVPTAVVPSSLAPTIVVPSFVSSSPSLRRLIIQHPWSTLRAGARSSGRRASSSLLWSQCWLWSSSLFFPRPSSSHWSTHNPHASRCSLWQGGCWVSAVVPSSGVVAPILVVVPSSFSPSSPHRCRPFYVVVVPVFWSSPRCRRPCPWSSLSCHCRQQVYSVPKNLLVIN